MTDHIQAIASQVRFWAEGRAAGTKNEHDLNGWCAIASSELYRQLKQEGYSPTIQLALHPEGGHVFVSVDDLVVDVTATQFPQYLEQPVLIVHERELDTEWYHTSTNEFSCPEDLIRYQRKTRWPREQIAYGN